MKAPPRQRAARELTWGDRMCPRFQLHKKLCITLCGFGNKPPAASPPLDGLAAYSRRGPMPPPSARQGASSTSPTAGKKKKKHFVKHESGASTSTKTTKPAVHLAFDEAVRAAEQEQPADKLQFVALHMLHQAQVARSAKQKQATHAATLVQAHFRGRRLRRLRTSQEGVPPSEWARQAQLLVIMDPGQDLDDEMFIVLAAALAARGLVQLHGVTTHPSLSPLATWHALLTTHPLVTPAQVITTLAPAGMRARLARGTLDQLNLNKVHLAAGTDGGSLGDPDSVAQMASVDYLTRLPPQEEAGLELMTRILTEAKPRCVCLELSSVCCS